MYVNLIDVWKRLTPWSKSVDVYANGIDNAYPETMDGLINNSVTAKSAAAIMVQYLIGKGYGLEKDEIIVNKEKNLKLIDFADDVADDLVKQRGVFIHINYNALYQITDVCVIPFEKCKLGKKDSTDYAGKIAIHKDWVKAKKSEVELIDVYNPRKEVIEAQVTKAGGWEHYKGQVLYINMDTKLTYPLSRIDSVADDCDSEAQASRYKNRLLRKGFFGNTLVVTTPMIGKDLQQGSLEYREAETERDKFHKSIKDLLGAENAGNVLCLEMELAGHKLEETILIKQIESNIDDKLFTATETSVRENILVAFNNLPAGLVKTSDNSLFGNSGTAIIEMKRTYWENTTKDRNVLTATLNLILKNMQDYKGDSITPMPLILLEQTTTTEP